MNEHTSIANKVDFRFSLFVIISLKSDRLRKSLNWRETKSRSVHHQNISRSSQIGDKVGKLIKLRRTEVQELNLLLN